RPAAFDMADWLRQSKRAHHALEKSARGNGRPEPLTHSVAVEMAIVTMTMVVLTGCGGMSRRGTDTVIGAGVGGVAGAVLTGGSALGTVGGAAVGGVVGNQVGK
ncbi:glycine zipper 2TM domain-containing protein, partial [Burkholderia ambifaria]|uniref:glycine zipper 2TM domain-containing protein n=2 Tax=Burkholderia ambifaria TaxID=152480 RepID=UPI001FC7CDEA